MTWSARSFAAGALVAMAGAGGACGAPSGHDVADSGAIEAAPETPSVSAIIPSRVFLARTTQVTLSGYATHWSAGTKVDFGPGITVEDVVAASPTALVARVTTTKSTPIGVRDVVVDDGSSRERYAGAFAVLSPLSATFQGTMAQGGLARITLQVLDTSTPLDTTPLRHLDGTVTYPNLALDLPSGVGNLGVADVSDFDVTFGLSVDVDAAAGTGDFDLVSGPAGATTDFPLPSGVRVTARTAAPITSGVAGCPTGRTCCPTGSTCAQATGQITSAYDSALYAVTPSVMTVVDFSTSSLNQALDPAVALLPSSGHFADLLGFGYQLTAVAPGGVPLYAVYWENTGGTGTYSVTAASTVVRASAAATPADFSSQGAIAVSALPFVLTNGDLAKNPYDWVKLTVASPTTLWVQTTGDLATDTRVTAYLSDAVTVTGYPIDSGNAADGTIPLKGAGTYYVEFSQGMDFTPPHTKYTAIIRD
jgi:hypothetical protein